MSKFNELANQAAELERAGKKNQAALEWDKAAANARKDDNREWCEHRARFCDSRRWA